MFKYFFLYFFLFCTEILVPNDNTKISQLPILINKKGLGFPEKSSNVTVETLKELGIGWYYNWGVSSKLNIQNIPFIPMIFSLNSINKLSSKTPILLGFNEPDNSSQSDISTEVALNNWERLVNLSIKLGSPATAGNPLNNNGWLFNFYNNVNKPKIDFICIHWYKGCNSKKFIEDIQNIINLYKIPVWITEFAPQTVKSSKMEPNKYSLDQVKKFMIEVTTWMNKEKMVEAYSWHDSKYGTSALFNKNGTLTPLGETYKNINFN